jgi:Spy/CpxP family protein refolding chaperone
MTSKYKIDIVVSLAAVFIIGAGAGYFAGRAVALRSFDSKKAAEGKRSHHPPTVERLTRELSLTPPQQEALRSIFQKSEERFCVFDKEYHKRLRELRLLIKNDIDAILTSEQKQKLERMIREHEEEMKKRKKAEKGSDDPSPKDKGDRP